jgi:hypothetical protein
MTVEPNRIGRPALDISGGVFGRLTVIGKSPLRTRFRTVLWICRCACGQSVLVRSEKLRQGRTRSCGCTSTRRDLATEQIVEQRVRRCEWCDAEFAVHGTTIQAFCSRRHRFLAESAVRRSRENGAVGILPPLPYIYRRDGCQCQICGLKVSLRHPVGHPLSATRDHIVPLTLGGSNDAANIQLAHHRCNGSKGNRRTGDQLRLIG